MVNLTKEKELHEWLMEWFSRGRCIAWDEGPCHPLCSRCAEEKYFRSWCKDNGVKVTID